ncbi:hypothetical protein LCGC14_2663670, partial [marine sediment metagenome]
WATDDLRVDGWRIAWIDDGSGAQVRPLGDHPSAFRIISQQGPVLSPMLYVCPQEQGRKRSCEKCRYSFEGKRGDVVFLLHTGAKT